MGKITLDHHQASVAKLSLPFLSCPRPLPSNAFALDSVSTNCGRQFLARSTKRSSRGNSFSLSSLSAFHNGKGAAGAVLATLKKWPLENMFLKGMMENGFLLPSCILVGACEHASENPRSEFLVKKWNVIKRRPRVSSYPPVPLRSSSASHIKEMVLGVAPMIVVRLVRQLSNIDMP